MKKCKTCYWASDMFAYEGECEYHYLGQKGECQYMNKDKARAINKENEEKILKMQEDMEKERLRALDMIKEDCEDGC